MQIKERILEQTRASSSIGSFNYETFWGNSVLGRDITQLVNSMDSFGVLGDNKSQNVDIYYDRYFAIRNRQREDPEDDGLASLLFDLYAETYSKDMRNRCYQAVASEQNSILLEG